jgi:hypothetical protein
MLVLWDRWGSIPVIECVDEEWVDESEIECTVADDGYGLSD